MTNLIGIDIGGTKCSVILGGTTQKGSETQTSKSSDDFFITEKIVFPTPINDPNATIKLFLEKVKKLLKKHNLDVNRVQAVGISCGGPLDSQNGIILSPPNLPGWNGIRISDIMENELDLRPVLQNDANACAIAELKWGAGRGMKNFVFLTFGTGMGAGLILNGALYSGTNDMAGEIGHIRMEDGGPVGYGKAGSFEGYCSGGGIAQLGRMKAMEQIQLGRSVVFCPDNNSVQSISAKTIGEFAEKSDPLAQEIFHISGSYLGRGIAILIDILNPEAIIIGSIFIHQKELLLPSALEVIKKEALSVSSNRCKVLPAGLGDKLGDAAALGIAAYSLEV
jgi:glucokinase